MSKLVAFKTPAKREVPYKAFDKFQEDADYLVENYKLVAKALDEALVNVKHYPVGALKAAETGIESLSFHSGRFPTKTLEEVTAFYEAHYEFDDDEDKAEQWTRGEVGKRVALLLGSFPNTANIPDPDVYTRMLVEEIIAAEPYLVAVESTCREIRRKSTFVPAIGEVITTLKKHESEWGKRIGTMWGLPKDYADLIRLRDDIEELVRRGSKEERHKPGRSERLTKVEHWKLGVGGFIHDYSGKRSGLCAVTFSQGDSCVNVLQAMLQPWSEPAQIENKPTVPLDFSRPEGGAMPATAAFATEDDF